MKKLFESLKTKWVNFDMQHPILATVIKTMRNMLLVWVSVWTVWLTKSKGLNK